jgi:hypothetical protein
MKILLDESVPRDLKDFIPAHYVFTGQEMGWTGVKNGSLLKQANALFDCFITVDKNMQYQQNFTGFNMCFITLMAKQNKMSRIIPLVPELLRQLNLLKLSSGTVINILPP